PARLPDPALAPTLLGRLLTDREPPRAGRPIDAEVLNGTGVQGLAARAAKMLRLRGVDVLTVGSTSARRRTLVYDRLGDFRDAARVLAALGCRDARAATRQDPTRVVDVSVLLGDDCAGAFGAASPGETGN
ncbi:MAG: LytR C-terminal domain-containing protein, partial [Elusimicrobia bacterium]|nr:LytR C-terminal domain-containing protein [Elusimicrobiota bacterium]